MARNLKEVGWRVRLLDAGETRCDFADPGIGIAVVQNRAKFFGAPAFGHHLNRLRCAGDTRRNHGGVASSLCQEALDHPFSQLLRRTRRRHGDTWRVRYRGGEVRLSRQLAAAR